MFEALVLVVGWLDSLPSSGRALLGGAVLAILLTWAGQRIPTTRPGLSIAYGKTTLVGLVVLPVAVYAMPTWRFVVPVEVLPSFTYPSLIVWWALQLTWLMGTLIALAQLVLADRETRLAIVSSNPADEKLAARLEIWKRRAHIDRPVQVRLGDTPVPWIAGPAAPCIVLPQDAGHWPVAVQDAVLMHELSHVDRNNLRWFVFGRVVAALYWPIPGVARLCFGLSTAYQQTSDVFAMGYIRDMLSYARGMRHVRARMDIQSQAHRSIGSVRLAWGDIDSLAVREKHIKDEEYCDPFYDRVFWALIQATLAVFLLTGMTLEVFVEEDPPSVMLFERWEFSFQRIERDEGLKVIKRYSRNSRRTESPTGDK